MVALTARVSTPSKDDGTLDQMTSVGERTEAKQPSGMPTRFRHIFSGPERVGSLSQAFNALGLETLNIDNGIDPVEGDVLDNNTFARLMKLAESEEASQALWWFGTVCSSFARVRGKGVGPPQVRSRVHVEGLPEMESTYGAYIAKHNEMVRRTCQIAITVWRRGGTVVIENPADVGDPESPVFRWDARKAPAMWLMPDMIEFAHETTALKVLFPQCALGSPFQKLTQLLVAGPRAFRLRPMGELGCACAAHAKRAEGFDDVGKAHSAAAAAYPPLMCGVVAALLATDLKAEVVLGRTPADDVMLTLGQQVEGEAITGSGQIPPRAQISWRAAPEGMPPAWEEREDIDGEGFQSARTKALKYVSRRRMESERPEVLFERPMPAPSLPPKTEAEERYAPIPWPSGAPPRPVHISALFPRSFKEFCKALKEAAASCDPTRKQWPRFEDRVFDHSDMPQWAAPYVWDTRNHRDCVPLQPFTDEDAVQHELSAHFFGVWARRLAWVDKDMLRQVCIIGAEGRSQCERVTVVMGHHSGLRHNPGPAIKSVAADEEAGWISKATQFPPTVPNRMVAKNLITATKWKMVQGKVSRVTKFRVATDDSADVPGATSRNHSMDKSEWQDAGLPGPRTLAEAVAMAKAVSRRLGMHVRALELERIALWALDLSDAYRMLGVQRSEWWLQCFVWTAGVRLDRRAVFGSAHLPGLFQRITTFVIAVARSRIRAYDTAHPYSAARQAWRKERAGCVPSASERAQVAAGTDAGAACAAAWPEADDTMFQAIYIDDGFGLTALSADEPLTGLNATAPRVSVLLEAHHEGGVKLTIFAGMSRAEIHLEIAADTCEQGGWIIQRPKVQLAFNIDLLGLHVATLGEAGVSVPEAKRLGMLSDIEAQLAPEEGAIVTCARSEVETLTGRCGHIAMAAAEGNAYLSPMWKVACARRKIRLKDGRVIHSSPSTLSIGGTSPVGQEYQRSLRWWHAALSVGVRVPLAPRETFPDLREEHVGFFFTDAAREEGTGIGAFSVVEWTRNGRLGREFLYISERWSPRWLAALQCDDLSMACGELFGNVAMAVALLVRLPGLTHLVCFTDSSAAMGAINSGNSPSLQLNVLVQWLYHRAPGLQLLAVHQPGVRNDRADGISRSNGEAVVAEARAHGASPRRLGVAAATWAALDRALRAPQRGQ